MIDTNQVSPCSCGGTTRPPCLRRENLATQMLSNLLQKRKSKQRQKPAVFQSWVMNPQYNREELARLLQTPAAHLQQDSHYQTTENQSFATVSCFSEVSPLAPAHLPPRRARLWCVVLFASVFSRTGTLRPQVRAHAWNGASLYNPVQHTATAELAEREVIDIFNTTSYLY